MRLVPGTSLVLIALFAVFTASNVVATETENPSHGLAHIASLETVLKQGWDAASVAIPRRATEAGPTDFEAWQRHVPPPPALLFSEESRVRYDAALAADSCDAAHAEIVAGYEEILPAMGKALENAAYFETWTSQIAEFYFRRFALCVARRQVETATTKMREDGERIQPFEFGAPRGDESGNAGTRQWGLQRILFLAGFGNVEAVVDAIARIEVGDMRVNDDIELFFLRLARNAGRISTETGGRIDALEAKLDPGWRVQVKTALNAGCLTYLFGDCDRLNGLIAEWRGLAFDRAAYLQKISVEQ